MKLKEFINGLILFGKENPEALEMDIVTSKDDEGNGYNPVYFTPTIGIYEDDDFISKDQFEDHGREDDEANTVCVN